METPKVSVASIDSSLINDLSHVVKITAAGITKTMLAENPDFYLNMQPQMCDELRGRIVVVMSLLMRSMAWHCDASAHMLILQICNYIDAQDKMVEGPQRKNPEP